MKTHNRRKKYWQYYEMARRIEAFRLRIILLTLIQDNPHPRPESGNRGRPPVHTKEKLDWMCLMMIANNDTFREIESKMHDIRTQWDNEPIPDHTTLVRHIQGMSEPWLDMVLAKTAHMCLAEAGGATGPLVVDSSGVETTRYEIVEQPVGQPDKKEHNTAEQPGKKEPETVKTRRKIHGKYHIAAISGLQIVLAAFYTPNNISDTVMLPVMTDEIMRRGFDLVGYLFNADKGYDSDSNCEDLFSKGFIPNIKQRKNAKQRDKPNRKKAAEIFDADQYNLRPLIEGIFGAEETRGHQLHCRFVREDNRRRFAKGRAIAWTIRALNRFECANRLNIPIVSYGTHA